MTIPAVEGRCDECGFDYDSFGVAELPDALGGIADAYRAVIARCSDEALRRRPAPEVWSVLEYTCHVRDVLQVQRERLTRALEEDDPTFPRAQMWRWPERDGYNASDPSDVLRLLRDNAAAFAEAVCALTPSQLERTLVYSYPEPTQRTIGWLLAHTAHECRHYRIDIERIAVGGVS